MECTATGLGLQRLFVAISFRLYYQPSDRLSGRGCGFVQPLQCVAFNRWNEAGFSHDSLQTCPHSCVITWPPTELCAAYLAVLNAVSL